MTTPQDELQLRIMEILGDDDFMYTDKPHRIEVLINSEVRQVLDRIQAASEICYDCTHEDNNTFIPLSAIEAERKKYE